MTIDISKQWQKEYHFLVHLNIIYRLCFLWDLWQNLNHETLGERKRNEEEEERGKKKKGMFYQSSKPDLMAVTDRSDTGSHHEKNKANDEPGKGL